jgi:hypothetical protein
MAQDLVLVLIASHTLENINSILYTVMNKKYSLLFSAIFSLVIVGVIYGCEKDYVAKPPVVSKSFTEEFDTVAKLYTKDWVFVNNSNPQGAATWQQGVWVSGKLGPDGFPAYSYKASGDEYIFAGFASGNDVATLSSWMITPAIEMKNGDKFSFYTRTYSGSTYPDRMQVRMNLTDNSADVGKTESSVGKFTTLLTDINPSLTLHGYPETWKQYEFTITGLPAPLKRRIAFRYYVSGGGPSGGNSNAIGIDQFKFQSL